MSGKPEHDDIQMIMGRFGKYQFYLCLLLFLSKFPIAFHQMGIIFLAPKVNYTCADNNKPNSCPCKNPTFDKTIFTNTIVMQWHLICGRKYLVSLAQTVFQLGTLAGSVIFGMASDRYGRKKPMLVAVVMQAISGVAAAYVNNYWLFDLLRFVIGLSVGGTMVIGFVIIVEFIGAEYRQTLSAVYQAPFNLGHMMLPGISYLLNDYSKLQLVTSATAFILLVYFCLLPETPRWLLARGKSDHAVKILSTVAKINKRPTGNIQRTVDKCSALVDHNLKNGTILDLFKTPNLRKNILAMSFDWLACSYCFYGVSQYVGHLSGNVFINVAVSAGVTFLGTLTSIPIMKFLGRRTIIIVTNYVCVVCLIILAIIPHGLISIICACVGVVGSFITFILVYLYCTEMFPTVVRNAALGFSSMMARVGAMIAPFVIDLKSFGDWLPPLVFAICPLVAGTITFLLPETKGVPLMTTIDEGERFSKTNIK